mmetsp:Transcript_23235/g.58112  ORF Transcript_23235/g.58112 Transcript_23235/m.58112 type:complete len:408 (-) Transcript_23235:198-1421(-)|eukprot:CAMPEP_0177632686 /NCGR_PEP_ID=MMETSP0447-20121125/2436_1 /TAXON_ID=0 /ORGANISM="Stygamoeba regulata, Strain BSH-02190019" /LENGTH=407 /DNA_ID=CAMNT_0019134295 /DNA_START=38 /DNA_END=1261 /DNA_ORIENTATION=+
MPHVHMMPVEADPVCVVAAVRTPLGCFMGALASLSAVELGSICIREAVSRSKLCPSQISDVCMGCVLPAGLGQNPARLAALQAGLATHTRCTTINKVCSSGLKAIMAGAMQLQCGYASAVVVGGMESMTNVPHYMHMRKGKKMGDMACVDGMLTDGLWDHTLDQHMGHAAEQCAARFGFTREDQDLYAQLSYQRASDAISSGHFRDEIVPVAAPAIKALVCDDEQPSKLDKKKMVHLRPCFPNEEKVGTITAANASPLSDGASALVLVRRSFALENRLDILAEIVSFGEFDQDPVDFTTAPAAAAHAALARADLQRDDVHLWEINEAFSVVALANMKLLGLTPERVNVNGGAVALGHPLGCSGARIVVTLLSALRQRGQRVGCAAVCNGGGGAISVVVRTAEAASAR